MKINNLKIGLGAVLTNGLVLGLMTSVVFRKMFEEKHKEISLKKGIYLSNTDSINKMMEVTEYYNEIWNHEWED